MILIGRRLNLSNERKSKNRSSEDSRNVSRVWVVLPCSCECASEGERIPGKREAVSGRKPWKERKVPPDGRESLSGTGSLKRGEGTTCSRAKALGSREPGRKEGLPRKHVYMPETVYITIAVAIAKRSHLFSCRTQKLSSSTPKVLGWQRPGRLGSRRIPEQKEFRTSGLFFCCQKPPNGAAVRQSADLG